MSAPSVPASRCEIIEYRYDAFDRLIGRLHDADGLAGFEESEYYVYDSAPGKGGLDDIVLTYDENGNVVHRYLHGPAIDQIFADESAVDGILWALADRQRTVRDWADYDAGTDSTSVYDHVVFDSFGQILSQTNNNHEVAVGYTGRYTDPVTGLQWNRGRWYDPTVGRWLSEDPIGFGGGDVNLHRYVGNGTTVFVDPSGLQAIGDFPDQEPPAPHGFPQFPPYSGGFEPQPIPFGDPSDILYPPGSLFLPPVFAPRPGRPVFAPHPGGYGPQPIPFGDPSDIVYPPGSLFLPPVFAPRPGRPVVAPQPGGYGPLGPPGKPILPEPKTLPQMIDLSEESEPGPLGIEIELRGRGVPDPIELELKVGLEYRFPTAPTPSYVHDGGC